MAAIEEAIETFRDLTSLPKPNAIEWLRANNNDVQMAVNAWMDNNNAEWPPKQNSVNWDESNFHSDRAADVQQHPNPPSFSVQGPDTLNPNVFGAPSRPPSRASNKGRDPNHMQLQGHYSSAEDDDIQRAMAMSLEGSQTLPGQETGVTDFNRPTFGPAEKAAYDPSEWAMTVPGTQTREILLNPEPHERKRQPSSPAFFKPSSDNFRLSALLKILHEIPIAKEALLNKTYTINDYGHNSEWWDGQPIKVLKVVNLDQGHQESYGQDVIHETQRLMAFLDKTERAYGSVDVLASFQSIDAQETRVPRFLKDWHDITVELAPGERLTRIFRSRGIKKDLFNDEIIMDEEVHSLTLRIDQRLADNGLSLYDALDDELWGDARNSEVYLAELADVLIIEANNIIQNGSGLGIEVPATCYLDRYLESSTDKAKEMLKQKGAVYEKMEELEEQRQRLLRFQTPAKPSVDASTLLLKATAYFEETASYNASNSNETPVNGVATAKASDVLEELKTLSDRIQGKLNAFEKVRDEAHERLKEISRFYTQPTNDPETTPTHKYSLRGVATTLQTLYVLEKTQPERDDDILSSEAKDWQWWKFEYISTDQNPVTTTKTSEDEVLRAARSDSTSALLVYASERAIIQPTSALPSQLENFVRADNLSFSAELEQNIQLSETSPGKRKAVDSDSDDMITHHSPTPPQARDIGDDELDPDPPEYNMTPSPPPRSRTAHLRDGTAGQGSSDDLIPMSLQDSDAEMESVDFGDNNQRTQEMEEMGGAGSMLRGQEELRGHTSGSYEPEIKMDDEEEGKANDKEKVLKPSPTITQGRGTRDDTW